MLTLIEIIKPVVLWKQAFENRENLNWKVFVGIFGLSSFRWRRKNYKNSSVDISSIYAEFLTGILMDEIELVEAEK